jgi:hypothetical protein
MQGVLFGVLFGGFVVKKETAEIVAVPLYPSQSKQSNFCNLFTRNDHAIL